MQCELIFYVARKTGINQKNFDKKLLGTDLKLTKMMVATSPLDLAEQLKGALNRSNLVFIMGGLARDDETNIVDILSKSIESIGSGDIDCKRIDSQSGSSGFIVQSGRQMIVMLPDVPDEIGVMAGPVLMKYISDFYGLKYRRTKDNKDDVHFEPIKDSEAFFNSIKMRTDSYDYEEPVPTGVDPVPAKSNNKLLYIILIIAGILAVSAIALYIIFNVVLKY